MEQGRSTGHEGLSGVLDRTIESIMRTNRRESAADTAVRAVVLERLVEHLIAHLDEPATGVAVRAKVRTGLADILQAVDRSRGGLAEYGGAIVKRIEDAFARARTPAVKTPVGQQCRPAAQLALHPQKPVGTAKGNEKRSAWRSVCFCAPIWDFMGQIPILAVLGPLMGTAGPLL